VSPQKPPAKSQDAKQDPDAKARPRRPSFDRGTTAEAKKPDTPDISKISNVYKLQRKVGQGCFGAVYRGINMETDEEVAIKMESTSADVPQLKHESSILNHLNPPHKNQSLGFPQCFFFGMEGAYLVLVMNLMSTSFEDCVQMCRGRLSVKSTLIIAEQVLMRIEYLHSKGILHRDIKPENFMWGAGTKQNVVHVIDFGLSKRWHTGAAHIPFKDGASLTGTARYVSIAVHRGHEQGRRDDLEAIGHMFVYFLRGSLPWSGLDARNKQEKYQKIMRKRKAFPSKSCAQGFQVLSNST